LADSNERVVRCFASVFPNLTPRQILTASIETVAEWDSLATVTIVALLEQEFGVQIDQFDLPELSSFYGVKNYLSKYELISGMHSDGGSDAFS
jgi:acyl carrier protein